MFYNTYTWIVCYETDYHVNMKMYHSLVFFLLFYCFSYVLSTPLLIGGALLNIDWENIESDKINHIFLLS